MNLVALVGVVFADPTPAPTSVTNIDPERVQPGLLGLLSFFFLVSIVVIIWFSMNKQLRRIDFDEDATEVRTSKRAPVDGVSG